MKLNNLELSLALADHALAQRPSNQSEILQLADYLATHPTSAIFYERALQELGIDPDSIPTEGWGTTLPTEGEGAAAMKEAITYLNQQWHAGKLQRRVAVRNLAWAAQLLARRLDADCEQDCKDVVERNGGSTAGLFKSFVQPATRSELQALQAGATQPQQPENQHDAHSPTPA